ncbi:MAG: DUF4097 domain-containing protein [Gammaproteobacteria bacterium]|nr:DUF4097 domain-containing protein [Gammaproteobacteria bacterium]
MRSFIVIAMFVASFADAAWNDYTTVRELKLDAEAIEVFEIDAGAGSMEVRGVSGLDRIAVVATVIVPQSNEDEAMKYIDKKMRLSLDSAGNRARLISDFDDGMFGKGSNARIDLEISLPAGIAIEIDDGSGSIDLVDIAADVSIDDGSGSIDAKGVANISIDDGSGSIDVSAATGDVSIVDGSGSINVRSVAGSVTIDDGSGSIKVKDVEQDLIVVEDGSGGFSYSDVRGSVKDDS